ncbi:hypothetical protein [Streptomyces malaysiensis]|uniref:Uncharacterized protein n=1 Tax=Streptomyces malaysiensis subsp. samsunensis TaxID=459658 RepID=A0A9X2LXE1_STRMQ|nr:hypothetical protein [Streptomyces samsunensis]MCQ8832400.1 hypothetical protein [Streptomyces samsunensis]
MNANNPPDRGERPTMTMRVYTMARDGIITAQRAMVTALVGEKSDAYGLGQAWPPCQCPRHRGHNDPNRFKRS